MNGGFAILRSGIIDHLIAGRLGYPELGIYTVIHLQADFKTGIWWGSASRLLATAPRGTNLRDVQRWLQTLTRIRFLHPFHKHGERGNYPVLIDKYLVRTGALRGTRLNAWKSESWEHPYYELCAVPAAVADAVPVTLAAPSSVFSKQESEKINAHTINSSISSLPHQAPEANDGTHNPSLPDGFEYDSIDRHGVTCVSCGTSIANSRAAMRHHKCSPKGAAQKPVVGGVTNLLKTRGDNSPDAVARNQIVVGG